MIDAASIAAQFRHALEGAAAATAPFRHWLLRDVLPPGGCAAITGLPIAAPHIADTLGKRETNNSTRLFFSPENRARHPICGALAEALQGTAVVHRLERLCGATLRGGFLRIE